MRFPLSKDGCVVTAARDLTQDLSGVPRRLQLPWAPAGAALQCHQLDASMDVVQPAMQALSCAQPTTARSLHALACHASIGGGDATWVCRRVGKVPEKASVGSTWSRRVACTRKWVQSQRAYTNCMLADAKMLSRCAGIGQPPGAGRAQCVSVF